MVVACSNERINQLAEGVIHLGGMREHKEGSLALGGTEELSEMHAEGGGGDANGLRVGGRG